MTAELQLRTQVKGTAFGVRGCVSSTSSASCTCNPCDCNPCTCGGKVLPPRWRVSGYYIEEGTIEARDVAGVVLLILAQPSFAGDNDHWQQTILVDEQATQEQIAALLTTFEDGLDSLPAEVKAHTATKKAVYKVPMHYKTGTDSSWLHVEFVPQRATMIRPGAPSPQAWSYHGPIALREQINLHNK